MPYQPLIPQPTDRLRVSQGDLLGNFQNTPASGGLGTMLNPNQGYIQFPNQGAIPMLTAPQPGFYAATYLTVSELFVNKNITGPAQKQVPFTASTLSTTAAAPGQDTWFYLPSGHLVKTGTRLITVPAAVYTITYPVNAATTPVFTDIISSQLTLFNQIAPPAIGAWLLSGVTSAAINISFVMTPVPSVANPIGVSYFVIGY